MTLRQLQKQYEDTCNEYARRFCTKQGMDFDGWVADNIGGIAYCSDFFFDMDVITWDMNTHQPKGLVINWYDYFTSLDVKDFMNYRTFTKAVQ